MNGGFAFFFAFFWSTLVLLFDGYLGWSLWNQVASRSYPRTTGQITHSEVTRHRGSKGGTTYGVDIWYRYAVNDRFYSGTRFRYNAGSSSDSGWARKAVAEHRVGSQAQVFYNPGDPQDALLSPGVDGSDLMLVLFLMPFNMIMFGLWAWLGGWLRERIFKPIAGGVRIITNGPRTSIRLPEYGALVWCMVAVGGLSFVSIFILALSSGFHPSLQTASGVLFVVAAAGAGAYAWQWRKIHSGDDDLILDEGTRTMELPETYGRKDRVEVAFSEIESLTMETVTHTSSKGSVSYTYAPTLRLRGGTTSQKLADWSDQIKAGAFTDWLRERLQLPNVPSQRA